MLQSNSQSTKSTGWRTTDQSWTNISRRVMHGSGSREQSSRTPSASRLARSPMRLDMLWRKGGTFWHYLAGFGKVFSANPLCWELMLADHKPRIARNLDRSNQPAFTHQFWHKIAVVGARPEIVGKNDRNGILGRSLRPSDIRRLNYVHFGPTGTRLEVLSRLRRGCRDLASSEKRMCAASHPYLLIYTVLRFSQMRLLGCLLGTRS